MLSTPARDHESTALLFGEEDLDVDEDRQAQRFKRTKTILFLMTVGVMLVVAAAVLVRGSLIRSEAVGLSKNVAVESVRVGANSVNPCRRSTDPGCDEEGNYFEGDIDTPQRQINLEYGGNPMAMTDARVKQDGLSSIATHKWPGGVMYYSYNSNMGADKKARVDWAMNHIRASVPGVTFAKRTTQRSHVEFIDNGNGGCSSSVGKQSFKQLIRIANWCQKGSVVHEILHALGFWHEQSRPDRDNYVNIVNSNIEAGKGHNFNKRAVNSVDSKMYGYDYKSIMHYGKMAFSKNGQDTIVPRVTGATIGQRSALSVSDVGQLNAFYRAYTYELQLTTCNYPFAGTRDFIRFTLRRRIGSIVIRSVVDLLPPSQGHSGRYPFTSTLAWNDISEIEITALTSDAWCLESAVLKDNQNDNTVQVLHEEKWWFDRPCSGTFYHGGKGCTGSKIFSLLFCYKMQVRTCNRLYADSSSPVNIDLYGVGSTTPLRFSWGSAPAKAATSSLMTRCTTRNMGAIDKATVRWSSSDGWCTNMIMGENVQNGRKVSFITSGEVWFDKPISPTLQHYHPIYSGDHTFDARYRYRVTVRTCNRAFAETGASISFYIRGDYYQSPTVSTRPASAGHLKYLYITSTADLGRIESVVVATTSSDAWCVDQMKAYDYQAVETTDLTSQLSGGMWFDKPCSGNFYNPAKLCFSENTINTETKYRIYLSTCAALVSETGSTVDFGIVGSISSYLVKLKPPPRGDSDYVEFYTQYPLGTVQQLVVTATSNDAWCSTGVRVVNMQTMVSKDFGAAINGKWFDKPCVPADTHVSPCFQSLILS